MRSRIMPIESIISLVDFRVRLAVLLFRSFSSFSYVFSKARFLGSVEVLVPLAFYLTSN
jgi:hypothetical protein